MTTASGTSKPVDSQSRADHDSGEEINLLRVVNALLRHVRLIVALSLALAIISLVQGLTSPLSYTADASFIPQGSRAPSQASALAAQFGVGGGGDVGQSPQFYVDLIGTREIQRGVIRSTFNVRTDTGVVTGNLIKLLGIGGRTEIQREYSARKRLAGMVSASISTKTGVITLQATAQYPDLSAQIVAHFLDEINRFNLEGRQSRASAERKFTTQRLSEAQSELTQAEERLDAFNRTNRDFVTPTLALHKDRMSRTVVARQQIVTALMQADEQARIEEVRDTPAITVIEPPEQPIEPNSRGTGKRTLKSLIFGALLGAVAAFVIEFFRTTSARDREAFDEFVSLSRSRFRRPRGRLKSDK